jgi:hypothetical protein
MAREVRAMRQELVRLATELSDTYSRHYQPFEFALFGAILSVADGLLLVTLFKTVLIPSWPIWSAGFGEFWLFCRIALGCVGSPLGLAIALDRGFSKKWRVVYHFALIGILAIWTVDLRQMAIYQRLTDGARADINVLLSIMLSTIALWMLTHIALRAFSDMPRPRRTGQ